MGVRGITSMFAGASVEKRAYLPAIPCLDAPLDSLYRPLYQRRQGE